MKIEEIRNALKNKAQSLHVAPMTPPTVTQQPAPTIPQRQKMPPKQEQAIQKEQPAVVIPLNNAQTPEAPVLQQEPIVEAKPTTRKPSSTRRTKGNVKSAPLSDIEAVISELRQNIDYSTLPRCGNKPVLLKGGAEHLASILGLRTTSEVINRVQVLEKNFILYEVATTVYDVNGNILAVGLGSCNTHENKYVKQGMANSLNTILKMARKRSYVDAILSATGSSRIFTQDIEELAAMTEDNRN